MSAEVKFRNGMQALGEAGRDPQCDGSCQTHERTVSARRTAFCLARVIKLVGTATGGCG